MGMTTSYERVQTSAPLRQAALQSKSSPMTIKGPKISKPHWSECPELRPAPTRHDLTGVRCGRFVCVGLSPARGKWIVRCDCGKYEIKQAKSIQNPVKPWLEACQECGYFMHLWRRDFFNRRGRWPADYEEQRRFPIPR